MKLEWAPRAEQDLDHLYDYIAQDSAFYATHFVERLLAAIERLPDFPSRCRTVPEAGHLDTIRELIFQNYRVIYRIHSEALQIVAIAHSAQNIEQFDPLPWEE